MRLSLTLFVALAATASSAETPADVLVYYEPGGGAIGGFTDPAAALVPATGVADPAGIVSLGSWSDDPATGANDGRPAGIALGWRFPVPNLDGPDFRVSGNNFGGFHEPGIIEVAAETTDPDGRATPDGWQDEIFYLIRPSNYADLPADPRTAPAPVTLVTDGTGLFAEPHWALPLTGYADVDPDGDLTDIADAIDLAGKPVSLERISYVRVRSVTDSAAGGIGQISTEIDTITALHPLVSPLPVPETVEGWSATPLQVSPPGWIIEALAIDPEDSSLITTETDYRDRTATRLLRDGAEIRVIEPPVFVSFITPSLIGYTDFVDGGGIEPLEGGAKTNILQVFDIAYESFISHNPVNFGSGPPNNRISSYLPGSELIPVIETGGYSGPIAVTADKHIWYAEPQGNLYRFTPDGNFDGGSFLTLTDADRTLSLPLNALANGRGTDLLAHDFSTLRSIDTGSLATTEIATSSLTLGALEMWAGEIYLVATDYGISRSTVFRLTPDLAFAPGSITPTKTGAVATISPGHAGSIETRSAAGFWQTAPATRSATREATTLTTTSEAPSGIFRLRTTK